MLSVRMQVIKLYCHVDDGKRESKHHNKRVNREEAVRKMLISDAWKHLETDNIKLINA